VNSTGSVGTTTGAGTGTSTGSATGNEGNVSTVVGVGGAFFNGSVAAVTNPGEPIFDANGNVVDMNGGYAPGYTANAGNNNANTYEPPVYNGSTNAVTDVRVADATMNQVIGSAKRDRNRVGRNGQLLYSIAPRTNVDRSREVPDDGPTPALTGPLSR
jgi:hypothetical protein